MTIDTTGATNDPRVERRADELTVEEQQVGSDDPEAQAAAILGDSDERTANREDPAGSQGVEHRTSEDTVDPDESTDP